MNLFGEKINRLKLQVEEDKSKYFELKSVYDMKQNELNSKEIEIKSLESKNKLLTDRLTLIEKVYKDSNEQLLKNIEKIKAHEQSVRELNGEIERLESKFDELSLQLKEVKDELRNIHQLVDGA